MQEKIEADLRAAMIAGDKIKTEVLKGLKSALQYEAVNAGSADRSLSDEAVQKVLAREAKKRQETADIYKKAGESERAETELNEKAIIEAYLPEQASDTEIEAAVQAAITDTGATSVADMGKVIGGVRAKLGPAADGATIARITKELLSK